ncbi:RNA polymerase sigma factor [Mesorhizobium sp.]|uniref:RNA polymerase sigma factor n=1 Tax=Mesorhizobium sp. TaxID=1871066 RepID=UPI0012179B68|nr:RNA polymerase sigma factor [Mesorhizobium sp.]TIS67550.1 MAG: RNA polymerase sigma factor [Mesorhizobium sp.]
MTKAIAPTEAVRVEDLDDAALVDRAQQRDGAAFWLIIKRHNQRLYRIARAVLDDDAEAQDVLQETYIHAFMHLSEFRAEAQLSTWLTRITLNEALGRRRQRRPTVDVKAIKAMPAPISAYNADPEEASALAEIRRLLERAVSDLPEHFRIVFVMRDVEEMSTEETALLLGLRPQTVKTRLHRARRLLRETLRDKLATVFTDTFPFAGAPCDRLMQSVLDRLGISLLQLQAH